MKQKQYLSIITSIFLFIFIGCAEPTPKPSISQTNSKVSETKQKVSKAFVKAPKLLEEHSKWFDRDEALPLTIIVTAYIDPKAKQTKEYQAFKILVKKIAKDKTLLDKLSNKKLSSKYTTIKYIDYDKNADAQRKFNAAYTNRHSDKDTLTDILRPDNEHPSQELLIRINYDELKKGNLTIEGYKTVKQKNKTRNSYYYVLRKPHYDKLSKKEKNQAIINALLATLQLSIPEYVSIDRTKLIKKRRDT